MVPGRIRRFVFIASFALMAGLYFRCYYIPATIADLYDTVVHNYLREPGNHVKVAMLYTDEAFGVNDRIKTRIGKVMEQYNMTPMDMAIPPTFYIRSAISYDRSFPALLKTVLNRRMHVKLRLQKELLDFESEEADYTMSFRFNKWYIDRIDMQKIYREGGNAD